MTNSSIEQFVSREGNDKGSSKNQEWSAIARDNQHHHNHHHHHHHRHHGQDTASEYLPQVETMAETTQAGGKDKPTTQNGSSDQAVSTKPMVYSHAGNGDSSGGTTTPGDTAPGANTSTDWGSTTNGGAMPNDLISQLLRNQNSDAQTANSIAGLVGADGNLSDADHNTLSRILQNQQHYGDMNSQIVQQIGADGQISGAEQQYIDQILQNQQIFGQTHEQIVQELGLDQNGEWGGGSGGNTGGGNNGGGNTGGGHDYGGGGGGSGDDGGGDDRPFNPTEDMSQDPFMQAANSQMLDGIRWMNQIGSDPRHSQFYQAQAAAAFSRASRSIDAAALSNGMDLPEHGQLQFGDPAYGLSAEERLAQYGGAPEGFGFDELAYDARLASHEMQGNGAVEAHGPQGDIFLQTLLNGQNNGQAATFLDNPQDSQWFLQALTKSFNSRGQLTGNLLTQSVADTYYQATGEDILPQLAQQQILAPTADMSREAIYREFPDLAAPDGIEQLEKSSGWSASQVMADALWGHAHFMSPDGTLSEEYVRDFLTGANNPDVDPIDPTLINLDENTHDAYRRLLNSPNAADALNAAFLDAIGWEYGIENMGSGGSAWS